MNEKLIPTRNESDPRPEDVIKIAKKLLSSEFDEIFNKESIGGTAEKNQWAAVAYVNVETGEIIKFSDNIDDSLEKDSNIANIAFIENLGSSFKDMIS